MGDMAYFPAYFSYARTLAGLTDEQFGHVMRAAIQYAENGTVPELDALEQMGFAFIKEDIDRANDRYKRVCEANKRNIQKRWEAKKQADEQPAEQSDTVTDTTVYGRMNGIRDHTNVYETYQSKSKGKSKSNSKSEGDIDAADAAAPAEKKSRKKFVPPTVDEVREYCGAQGYSTIDPEGFIDYYEANGWRVGNQAMKDWKATVRNWARRDKERGAQNKRSDSHASGGCFGENNGTFGNDNSSFDTDDFWAAAVAASYADMEGDA